MRIELEGCVVRSLFHADAPHLARHANNRDIWINLRDRFPHPYSLSDAVDFIDMCRQEPEEIAFAIEVEGQAGGVIGYRRGTDVERTSAEVGYWLGREFWGRGIMTAALKAVRDHAIDAHALTRIYALPFEWNHASFRVLEKAGFVLEGRLRRSAVKDGKVIDQLLYAYIVPVDMSKEST